MINWAEVNSLQKEKLDIEINLNELIHDSNTSLDKINELKSEILYLDKKLSRLLGNNELQRQEEIKRKKSGIEQRNINNYYKFKDKYKKISKMRLSISKMLSVIEQYEQQNLLDTEEIVKVKR